MCYTVTSYKIINGGVDLSKILYTTMYSYRRKDEKKKRIGKCLFFYNEVFESSELCHANFGNEFKALE